MRGRATLISLLLVLAGCTVGPDYKTPAPWWSPVSWFSAHPAKGAVASVTVAAPVDPTWWRLFGDPELTALENRVANENLDVRTASVRLAESRAQLGIARADQFPGLNANGSYTREKISDKGVAGLFGGGGGGTFASQGTAANGLGGRSGGFPVGGTGTTIPPFNLFQYGFDASWELDLWGRVRREVESSNASLRESEETRRNTLLTALAEVARDYIQLRGVQSDIAIVQRNMKTDQQALGLAQDRQRNGLGSDLDVANAQAEVDTAGAQLPSLEEQEAQLINALSFLLGQPPNALAADLREPKPVPPVPPRVPVGIPSELARRRPDVRAAEAGLHAATAQIGVAVADFYPKISISGSLGIQALMAKDLGNWGARQYGFGPTITLPIFEGGRLKATLHLREQQQKEAAIAYQRTVLQALHDVDNALTAYRAEQRRRARLKRTVAADQRALGLARDSYTQGLTSFLDVLNAERQLLSAQQQLSDSTTTVSTNLVALYKALGGGWESAYPDEPAADTGQARKSRAL